MTERVTGIGRIDAHKNSGRVNTRRDKILEGKMAVIWKGKSPSGAGRRRHDKAEYLRAEVEMQ